MTVSLFDDDNNDDISEKMTLATTKSNNKNDKEQQQPMEKATTYHDVARLEENVLDTGDKVMSLNHQ